MFLTSLPTDNIILTKRFPFLQSAEAGICMMELEKCRIEGRKLSLPSQIVDNAIFIFI